MALLAVAGVLTTLDLPIAAAVGTDLVSSYVAEDLPLADPDSPMWERATPLEVPLSGQIVIAPKNRQPSITSMRLRSLNNGKWVAFLLEWNDPTKDVGGGLLDFKDSAAIQFPSSDGRPFYCMGISNQTVQILHWRSDFQQDIESGLPNASEIFPNMWVSMYPGGDDPVYLTGRAAGNPLSLADKTSPVEDLVAGGFGTLTSQQHMDAVGWAKWDNGIWKAVIARPMITKDVEDAQFFGGMETSLALAAWDGGKGEVNGKKSVSAWVTLKIGVPEARRSGEPVVVETAGKVEIIRENEIPVTLMVVTGIVLAVLVVAASAGTWVLARRAG